MIQGTVSNAGVNANPGLMTAIRETIVKGTHADKNDIVIKTLPKPYRNFYLHYLG